MKRKISLHMCINGILWIMLVMLQGCGQPQRIDNATLIDPNVTSASPPRSNQANLQSCPAPNDGSRSGYHSANDDTWFRDCDNPLHREYWRVFLENDHSAYIIPRPDDAPQLQPVCTDAQHALHPLVERYQLCTVATTTEQVCQVNSIMPDDALKITHFLHTQLRFNSVDDGITPFPIPSDIIDTCGLHPHANSADLTALCDREQRRLDNSYEIGFAYTRPGAVKLVARLNELYGIQ